MGEGFDHPPLDTLVAASAATPDAKLGNALELADAVGHQTHPQAHRVRGDEQVVGIVATIPMRSGGLATSGDYEQFFVLDGRHYCHILNPFTGKPVDFWRSVTVIAPMTLVAGSCSTIAMLSESDALPFLNNTGFQYLAIDRFGNFIKQEYAPVANE